DDGPGHEHHGHHHHGGGASTATASTARYICPMCPGVASDTPGDCPQCGMSLEPNPQFQASQRSRKTIYTCPMHPEIEQDGPGSCPICGMDLEPKTIAAEEEADPELRSMTLRFRGALALTPPEPVLATGPMVGIPIGHRSGGGVSRWLQSARPAPV